jgi:hypothetical protein
VLIRRLAMADFPPELRVPMLQLLGQSASVLAVDPLVRFAQGGRTLFGKPKLAPRSPEMLAALASLAGRWRQDRRVAPLLAVAANSSDPDIVAAAVGRAPPVRP